MSFEKYKYLDVSNMSFQIAFDGNRNLIKTLIFQCNKLYNDNVFTPYSKKKSEHSVVHILNQSVVQKENHKADLNTPFNSSPLKTFKS